MANWSNPTITSNYVTFVTEVKDRDIDAITLLLNAATNLPTGAIKLLRSPVKLQEWSGAAFADLILTLGGGGTGSATAAGARTNLGLGTMALQNSTAIAVTGGTIASIVSSSSFAHTGTFSITNSSVATAIIGFANNYTLFLTGSATASQSFGLAIFAGTNSADICLNCVNAAGAIQGPFVRGDMVMRVPHRLVIPVGTDKWAT